MGTPSDPDEPDYGDGAECTECVDTIFNGHTPKYVKATFEGIETCPAKPPAAVDGSFILEQRAGFPCRWLLDITEEGTLKVITWRLNMGAGPNNSQLDYEIEAAPVFRGRSSGPCDKTFGSNLDCDDGWDTHKGTGSVTWGPNIDQDAYDAQFP